MHLPLSPVLAALALTGHALYPIAVWAAARRRAAPVAPDPRDWPPASVVIPAYREAAVIKQKVANVQSNGYPGLLEIIVVAEDEQTADAARGTEAVVIATQERCGKAANLNRGVEAASHEYIVLTDADAHLFPGALAALLRWFADPAVGAAAGAKVVPGRTGEALYWRFESWLKGQESRLGTTIGISGGLFAVRRSTWRPLPQRVIADDFWIALDVIEGGHRVGYEPEARWSDDSGAATAALRHEWDRRSRVVVGTLDLAWRRRHLLVPGSGVAGQLWGHRVIRSSLGPLAHALLLLSAVPKAGASGWARLFVFGHMAAGAMVFRRARGHRVAGAENLLSHLLMLQAVGLSGTWRYVTGDRDGLYPKPHR